MKTITEAVAYQGLDAANHCAAPVPAIRYYLRCASVSTVIRQPLACNKAWSQDSTHVVATGFK